jgi:hypothetical protein
MAVYPGLGQEKVRGERVRGYVQGGGKGLVDGIPRGTGVY